MLKTILFVLQPAYVFPLELESGNTLFIYMGDRWNFYGPGSVSRVIPHILSLDNLLHLLHILNKHVSMSLARVGLVYYKTVILPIHH